MRTFAAHYLLTDSGLLLKNGMAVADDKGTIRFIDTKGELAETERMIFHSGLLIGAFEFIKSDHSSIESLGIAKLLTEFHPLLNKKLIALAEVIDLAIRLQGRFPEMNIPALLHKTEEELASHTFVKKTIPGLYLLSGLDLDNLHFTGRTRLKKVM